MKKKLYLLTIATALTLSVTACGNKAEEVIPAEEPTTVTEVANFESTIVEETVTEPTVVEEETFATEEESTSSEEPTIVEEEETEPTIVEEPTSSETDVVDGDAPANILEDPNYGTLEVSEDYEWYVTDEEMNALTIGDIDYIKGVYEFLSYHNPEFIKTDDVKYKASEYVRFLNDGGDLLALVNKDFSKAYDIIEEFGLDVVTDDGKELKASEMRIEISDYDTFWEAKFDILDYTGEVAEARGEFANGIDAINAGEITDYDKMMYHLNGYDKYTACIDSLNVVSDFYSELIQYLH